MTKPISPAEARGRKKEAIPSYVLDAVNELLIKNLSRNRASFNQDEVVDLALKYAADANIFTDSDEIFAKKQLDFEEVYRQQGWKVVYDGPAYNESYTGYWVFTS